MFVPTAVVVSFCLVGTQVVYLPFDLLNVV